MSEGECEWECEVSVSMVCLSVRVSGTSTSVCVSESVLGVLCEYPHFRPSVNNTSPIQAKISPPTSEDA